MTAHAKLGPKPGEARARNIHLKAALLYRTVSGTDQHHQIYIYGYLKSSAQDAHGIVLAEAVKYMVQPDTADTPPPCTLRST
jgi:hypothetical protein